MMKMFMFNGTSQFIGALCAQFATALFVSLFVLFIIFGAIALCGFKTALAGLRDSPLAE